MKKYAKETAVGLFVFVGIMCIAYMSVKLGNVALFSDNHYTLNAQFSDVTGLKANAPVQMFGVDIGYVERIELDQEQGLALVRMSIRKDISLTDDAIASIKTSGLIGDKFLKISPGGTGSPLKDGGTIFDTESSVDLEELISKFVFGKV